MAEHKDNDDFAALSAELQALRARGSEADKAALLRTLRLAAETKPGPRERLAIAFERWWPQMRLPVYGLGFASVLAVLVSVGMWRAPANAEFAPEVEEVEFGGDSAMLIESPQDHTTLIWLSDAAEEDEDDAPNKEDI